MPSTLQRGLNITNWFRFPASTDPARLRAYMPDAAMAEIRAAGFTLIRLCIQPQVLLRRDGSLDPTLLEVVLDAVRRLQRAGLTVIVDAHPETWNVEEKPGDRKALLDFWRGMAPALRRFDAGRTVVEVMNEPVFNDHAAWANLQEEALALIRRSLPETLVVLTGADWGSIEGLLRLRPVRDPRVVYSVHDYTPQVLAVLGVEEGLDGATLARLPFPVTDIHACEAIAAQTRHGRTRDLGRFYCSLRSDAGTVRARLATASAWGRRHGAPVMLLEFGANRQLNQQARLAYLAAVRAAAEQEGMGWALWGYGDIMGFPAQPGPSPARLDPGVLEALGLRGVPR